MKKKKKANSKMPSHPQKRWFMETAPLCLINTTIVVHSVLAANSDSSDPSGELSFPLPPPFISGAEGITTWLLPSIIFRSTFRVTASTSAFAASGDNCSNEMPLVRSLLLLCSSLDKKLCAIPDCSIPFPSLSVWRLPRPGLAVPGRRVGGGRGFLC